MPKEVFDFYDRTSLKSYNCKINKNVILYITNGVKGENLNNV